MYDIVETADKVDVVLLDHEFQSMSHVIEYLISVGCMLRFERCAHGSGIDSVSGSIRTNTCSFAGKSIFSFVLKDAHDTHKLIAEHAWRSMGVAHNTYQLHTK